MSRVAATSNDQAIVDRYLLPGEIRLATVRRHPAVLLAPSAQAVGGLLVAAILSATVLHGYTLIAGIVWAGEGVLLVNLIWKTLNWMVDYFVITSVRILLTSGLFTRNVAMMPLTKVTDMSFNRSFTGRLLGFGEFVVESAGQEQTLRTIDHIPYPETLYQVVCEYIFADKLPKGGRPVSTAVIGNVILDDQYDVEPDDTFVFGGPPSSSDDDEL
jgi:hypothetical protein